jgi:hypothetical protein
MARGFVKEMDFTQHPVYRFVAVAPRSSKNALIRAFSSDTFGSTHSRFTKRRKPETLYDIPNQLLRMRHVLWLIK